MDFKPFKIGKYLLLERLAMGGMAEVYRAKASGAGGFEKQLAIKRILPNYSSNEEFRRMFEYEARLSSMLTHANIVQVYDFVKSGETYLLAMEYVDGKNLRQFINKVKKVGMQLPVEFAVYIVNEVCKGLEYAHKKKDDLTGRPLNIIHRDMSPQNVMLSYEGAAKIVDFGIAKAKDRVDETRSGVIKGKFGYMSPEQANGEPVDHRTDIFSTAIILFELLTGRRLFATENDMATLKLIQECVIPSPSRINPKIQPELEKIVLKGLTKDLTLRYQSAGNFHRNLQEFLNKFYPSFTPRDVTETLHKVFKEEIEHEKKRFEQLYRQSIPFSQGAKEEGAPTELDQIKDNIDEEDVTRSEQIDNTAVTFIGEEGSEGSSPAPYDPEASISIDEAPEEKDEKTIAGGGDGTQVEPLLLEEDASVSTLGEGLSEKFDPLDFKRDRNESSEEDRTMIDDGSEPEESSKQTNTPTQERTAPTQGGTNPKSTSGLTLQTNDREDSRRKGSISFIKELASSNVTKPKEEKPSQNTNPNAFNSEFSLSTGSAKLEVEETPAPPKERKPVKREPEVDLFAELEPPPVSPLTRVRNLATAVLLLGLLTAVVSFYKMGGISEGVKLANRLVGNSPKPRIVLPPKVDLPVEPVRQTATDCTIDLQSDPPGAAIVINDKEVGQTPTTISVECQKAVDVTLRKDGFERISENIYTKASSLKIYKVLKKIPFGTLELRLSQNAEIYIDGKVVALGKVQEAVTLPLAANRKYQLRFKNEVLGIDTTREFFVQENIRTREIVRLEQPAKPRPPTKRRRR